MAQWHASDNGGFDEVPLGSPPLKPVSADSNGGPPHLEKVAHSLMAYSKADQGPRNIDAREATLLRAENSSLKQRLSAIENVRSFDANHACLKCCAVWCAAGAKGRPHTGRYLCRKLLRSLGNWRISKTGCRPVRGLGWQLKQAGLCQRAEDLTVMQRVGTTLQRIFRPSKQS